MSAPLSDVEPETTATAARIQSKNAAPGKAKRSYKTVDPAKRRQLIELVNEGQKTIKEAANRLKINYSTAKHIIKSQKSEVPELQKQQAPPGSLLNNQKFELPLKQQAAPIDVETLERKIKALTESSSSHLLHPRLGSEPKTFNSSLLSTSLSLGQSQ